MRVSSAPRTHRQRSTRTVLKILSSVCLVYWVGVFCFLYSSMMQNDYRARRGLLQTVQTNHQDADRTIMSLPIHVSNINMRGSKGRDSRSINLTTGFVRRHSPHVDTKSHRTRAAALNGDHSPALVERDAGSLNMTRLWVSEWQNTFPKVCAIYDEKQDKCHLASCSKQSTHPLDLPSTGFLIQHRRPTATSTVARTHRRRRRATMVQPMALNGCVVSHRYKFVYIHILKSRDMTIESFLKNALCGNTNMPCERGIDNLQVAHCTKVLAGDPIAVNDYLIWSVVRNPFVRLYSDFGMAKNFARRDFDIEEFVWKSHERSGMASTDPVHYQPQYQFLFSKKLCPVVDVVIRMESLYQDMQRLLNLIDSPELDDYHHMYGVGHQNDTDYGRDMMPDGAGLRTLYRDRRLVDRVVQDYALDFELFGYDKENIPEK